MATLAELGRHLDTLDSNRARSKQVVNTPNEGRCLPCHIGTKSQTPREDGGATCTCTMSPHCSDSLVAESSFQRRFAGTRNDFSSIYIYIYIAEYPLVDIMVSWIWI
jgi:hypothetical protein